MNDLNDTGLAASPVVRPRRRLPLVWIVPIASVLIGAWLAWDTWSKRGPTITVSFESAAGLKVGQSALKFKDVEMGAITAITVPPDRSKVVVTLDTTRQAEPMLGENTIFWVVKPGLFAGRISGLDTLLSGSYIQMAPPADVGRPQRHFVGREEPPVLPTTEPGHTFTLAANRIGSISIGSPIFFRDLDVGTVLSWDLGDLTKGVKINAFVRAPYDQYVHDETHFWNASGLSVRLQGSGVSVQVASVKALLLGGIEFDAAHGGKGGPVSAEDHVFTLYPDQDEAQVAGYGHLVNFKADFPGSVGGLAAGSDVTLHGLKVGEVTDVGLRYDQANERIVAPVEFRIEPSRIAGAAAAEGLPAGTVAGHLVQRGLRATLQASNLLTGQKSVVLDFYPDAPPAELRREGDVFIMPTADAGGFDTLQRSASELLSKINQIDFAKIGRNVAGLTSGLDSTVNSPQLKQTLTSLAATMAEIKGVAEKLDSGVGPALRRLPEITAQLQETLTKTGRLISSVTDAYGGDSKLHRDLDRMLPQLTDALRSIRALSDLLERHPEALVRGRPEQGSR